MKRKTPKKYPQTSFGALATPKVDKSTSVSTSGEGGARERARDDGRWRREKRNVSLGLMDTVLPLLVSVASTVSTTRRWRQLRGEREERGEEERGERRKK